MYISIRFNDKDARLIKHCRTEEEIMAEKKKWEKDYKLRQITVVKSGPGYIFNARRKRKPIWE